MADDVLTLLVHRGKRQIREDAAAGDIPADARDLSTLHEYVDANGYTSLDPWGFVWEPRVWEQWERCNNDDWKGWDGPRYPWIGTAHDALNAWLKAWGVDYLATRPTPRGGPMFEVYLKRRGNRGRWLPVTDSAEASAAVRRFIERQPDGMLGSSDWQGGSVRQRNEHKPFAHVSYNGRVWKYAPNGSHTEPATFGPEATAVSKL